MQKESISRRAFLEVSALGATVIASGILLEASSAEGLKGQEEKTMAIFICSVCGHIEFGQAPATCPVCHAPKDRFNQNDTVFKDAQAKSTELSEKHIPQIFVVKTSKLIHEQPTKDIAVRIGKLLHPMEEQHFIQWIDCYIDDKYISRILLTPGTNPAGAVYPKLTGSKVRIVEHCNLHGHWQAEALL
jgi:superoxide reductase